MGRLACTMYKADTLRNLGSAQVLCSVFFVHVEQAALAVHYILLLDGWTDPGKHNR